jgi:hypothetical protein
MISMIMKVMVNTVVSIKTKMEELVAISLNAFSSSELKVKWGLKMITDLVDIIRIATWILYSANRPAVRHGS